MRPTTRAPSPDNDNDEFNHSTEDDIPPVPVEQLLEFFYYPPCAGTSGEILMSFPKKLDAAVDRASWGLYAYEKLSTPISLLLLVLLFTFPPPSGGWTGNQGISRTLSPTLFSLSCDHRPMFRSIHALRYSRGQCIMGNPYTAGMLPV